MATKKQLKNSPPPQLTPWKPGQSGNPKGRPPKENCLTDILREKVDKEAIAEKLLALAFGKTKVGDMTALKYIYDRIDGLPKATHEIEGHVEGTINIIRSDD